MSDSKINHPGIVHKISDNSVEIAIMVTSGCASCENQSSCSLSNIEEKIIHIEVDDAQRFSAGQSVTIEMKQSLGTQAVVLGYFLPFLVLIISLLAFVSLGFEQGIAGLFTLGTLMVYYLILILFKNYLKKKFTYKIT